MNQSKKLTTALIETGKETESIKMVPLINDLEEEFEKLKTAIKADDLRGVRSHGRRLTALLTKVIIEKC